MPRQSSWRKEEQFFSDRLGAPQRVNEPTHLGADGRYDEDESPSPVHEKKQARTRGRSSTRLFTRQARTRGRKAHAHVSGRGWSRGVDGWSRQEDGAPVPQWRKKRMVAEGAMAHQPTYLLTDVGPPHQRCHRRGRKTARARNRVEKEQPCKSPQDRGKDGIRTHLQRRGCTTAQTCVQGIAELKQRRDAP